MAKNLEDSESSGMKHWQRTCTILERHDTTLEKLTADDLLSSEQEQTWTQCVSVQNAKEQTQPTNLLPWLSDAPLTHITTLTIQCCETNPDDYCPEKFSFGWQLSSEWQKVTLESPSMLFTQNRSKANISSTDTDLQMLENSILLMYTLRD